VGHPTAEERVGPGGLLVHVRVERVAGELGEVLDVRQRDAARAGHHCVADPQVGQRLAERVPARRVPLGAGDPAAGDRREHPRAGLHRRPLHVVLHPAHAAHLLTAAGPPRAAVDQDRQRGSVPRGFRRVLAIQDQQPSVPGGQPEDHVAREGRVGRDDRPDQAAPAAGREVDHLVRALVADEGADRAERLYLVRLRPLGVLAA
jgi:hypothetical protein